MTKTIPIRPLTHEAFAPFGQVIEIGEHAHHYPINGGMTERYHDLAQIELGGENSRPLISLFRAQPYTLPLHMRLMERHPFGSQAFMPLSSHPFLIIVAHDENGVPGPPLAFRTAPGQGVNLGINVWHGLLTPLEAVSDFIVIDRGGPGNNLEEHFFPEPLIVAQQD